MLQNLLAAAPQDLLASFLKLQTKNLNLLVPTSLGVNFLQKKKKDKDDEEDDAQDFNARLVDASAALTRQTWIYWVSFMSYQALNAFLSTYQEAVYNDNMITSTQNDSWTNYGLSSTAYTLYATLLFWQFFMTLSWIFFNTAARAPQAFWLRSNGINLKISYVFGWLMVLSGLWTQISSHQSHCSSTDNADSTNICKWFNTNQNLYNFWSGGISFYSIFQAFMGFQLTRNTTRIQNYFFAKKDNLPACRKDGAWVECKEKKDKKDDKDSDDDEDEDADSADYGSDDSDASDASAASKNSGDSGSDSD